MWGYAACVAVELSLSAVMISMTIVGASDHLGIGLTAWAIFSIGLWSFWALFACWAWILLFKLTRHLRAITQDRHPAADHSP